MLKKYFLPMCLCTYVKSKNRKNNTNLYEMLCDKFTINSVWVSTTIALASGPDQELLRVNLSNALNAD